MLNLKSAETSHRGVSVLRPQQPWQPPMRLAPVVTGREAPCDATVLLSRPTGFYVDLLLLFRKARHPLIACRQVPQALLPPPKDTQCSLAVWA